MEMLNNDFFIYAVLTSFLLSIISAPLGVFLTLKRMSLMGDAISHSLLPGMAISLMLFGFSTVGLLLGGLLTGLLVLLLMFWITQKTVLKDDSVLALIYLTMSSLGIILISLSEVKIDLMHFLFGNILLIPKQWILIIAVSVVIVLFLFNRIYKPLVQVIVDPEYSKFLRISENKVKNKFYFLVLWVLILSFYSVGTMLALGFLIIPAMLAKLFARSIRSQIILAALFGLVISVAGIVISFIWNIPTGPAIISFGGLLFILIMPLRKGASFLITVLALTLCSFDLSAATVFKLNQKNVQSAVLYSFPLLQQIGDEMLSGISTEILKGESLVDKSKSIHNYSILPSDINKFKNAKVLFVIGLGFENFNLQDFKKSFPELKIVSLSVKAPYINNSDPHLWNHPLNVIHMAKLMLASFVSLSPSDEPQLNANFKNYEQVLKELHLKYSKFFKDLNRKQIVVAHNSFGYFSTAYGIEIYSPSGFSSQDNSKPGDLIRIKELLIKNPKIPLFKEQSANNIFIEHLSEELKMPISGTLNGESFVDTPSGKFSYLNYIENSLNQIYQALKK